MGISYSNAHNYYITGGMDPARPSVCPDAIDEGRDSQVSVLSIMTKLFSLLVLTALTIPDYSFIQSEADTILFSAYAVLRDSSYSGPIVADTDTYMAAAPISHETNARIGILEVYLP